VASGAHEYEILLMGPGLNAAGVDSFAALLEEHSIHILERKWPGEPQPMALHMHCSRDEEVSGELRTLLMDEAENHRLDAFVLEATRQRPRLFVFDMDSTLIQAEIIDELAGLAGVKNRVAAITERAMRGEINFRGALDERLRLLKGLPEARLQELIDRVIPSEGLEELMQGLHEAKVKTAIVSGGFGFFGRHLRKRFGFDYLFCNELEIVDGVLTGRVGSEVVDATKKAASLREVAERESVPLDQVVAVGDGANDLPMMRLAGIGVAYRAKPVVKASAQYRLSHSHLSSLLHLL
jgi:phosphoserine phosphatase